MAYNLPLRIGCTYFRALSPHFYPKLNILFLQDLCSVKHELSNIGVGLPFLCFVLVNSHKIFYPTRHIFKISNSKLNQSINQYINQFMTIQNQKGSFWLNIFVLCISVLFRGHCSFGHFNGNGDCNPSSGFAVHGLEDEPRIFSA